MDTGFQVMLKNIFLHLLKSVYDRAQLDEDVNAVATLLDYLFNSKEVGDHDMDLLKRTNRSWGAYLERLAKANRESFARADRIAVRRK